MGSEEAVIEIRRLKANREIWLKDETDTFKADIPIPAPRIDSINSLKDD
jgi:hypothetical protein